MPAVTLPAHFDGQQIVLDVPYELEPNAPLTVTVNNSEIANDGKLDEERADWARLGRRNLAAAYGDDEPEYTAADIKEWNPLYTGPREW